MKKRILILLLIFTLCLGCFYGCRPKDGVAFESIYNHYSTLQSYSSSKKLFTLPEGVSLYYTTKSGAKDYSSAYRQTLGGFFVQKSTLVNGTTTNLYGFYGVDGALKVHINFTSFLEGYGFIVVGNSEGGYLYNANGGLILHASSAEKISPISENYIAVTELSGWCNIYKADGSIVRNAEGEDIKLQGKPTDFKAVDNYIIKTVTANKITTVSIYDVSKCAWTTKGRFEATSSSYSLVCYYLGDGNFYVYDMTTGATESDYTFKNQNEKYCLVESLIYNAASDTIKKLDNSFIYITLYNSYYYEEMKSSLDVNLQFAKGFSFASNCLKVNSDKTTSLDQCVLNSEGGVVSSMFGVFSGAQFKPATEGGYRDVALTYVGDIGFSTTTSGNIQAYDIYGNLLFEKGDILVDGKPTAATFSDVFINNGVIRAKCAVSGASKGYYVAIDFQGNEIVSISEKYTAMTPYFGGYAFAEKLDLAGKKKLYVLDSSGSPDALDVYSTGSGSSANYFYKNTAYVYKDATTSKFGLKACDGTILVEASADNIVIAKYGLNTLFFATIINNVFDVYSIV